MHKEIIEKFIKKFIKNHPNENIVVVGVLGFGSNFNQKKSVKILIWTCILLLKILTKDTGG